ncbi:bZIP transcription factor [Penicillium brasilianum]|uniref:BZIP transcription factor n=1 Tax=Penicillium brasilianum TaxID=104259 RepID=A0A1S9RDI5_PENBI|nr:bZIP transcription factor [Penicillium brasilianum]
MSNHALGGSFNYAAPSPPIEAMIEGASYPSTTIPKTEDSPIPSRSTSLGAEGLISENVEGNGPTTAGRKRKLNSTSSRGVANLTPDQLAKKRANDRQAQRAIRERTKSHIETLEQQVRDLASQKPVLDLQAALQHNERIRSENRELRQHLKSVMDIIQPLLARPEASDLPPVLTQPRSIPPVSHTPPFPESDHINTNNQSTAQGDRLYAESVTSADTPSPTQSGSASGSRRNSHNGTLQPAAFRAALDSQRHNLAHGLDLGTEERLGFNFLLDPSQNVPKVDRLRRSTSENFRSAQPSPAPLFMQQLHYPADQIPAYATPIRNSGPTCTLDSILLDFLHNRQREAAEGIPRQKLVGPPYPSVSSLLNPEKSAHSHPLSKVFTDILRTFPDISALPVQVAVLYTMFLLMRWQIYPTQENYDRLPEWLTPRPTQLLQAHPPWMDYVPWPRMRDRLVTSHQDYPFENWFIPFTRDMDVNWPYEATDCLLSAGDSEELIINPVFERHMRSLSNWSLGPHFAEAYPGLVDTTRIRPEPGKPHCSTPI